MNYCDNLYPVVNYVASLFNSLALRKSEEERESERARLRQIFVCTQIDAGLNYTVGSEGL